MNYKMICIDLDGTLFGKNKAISKETREVITNAHKNGVEVVITTGRLYNNAEQVSTNIGVSSPVIAANGAIVREKNTKKDLYCSSISYEKCEELLSLIKKYKVVAHFYTDDRVIANNPIGLLTALIYKYRNKDNKYKIYVDSCFNSSMLKKRFIKYNSKIVKCVLYSNNEKRITKFKEEALEIKGITIFGAGRYSLEINAEGVSKGNSVKILADHLGISAKDIICIGDNENDISMIKKAGLGVAMGNAIPELKEIADYVTDTNINDGVAKVIRKFVL